MGRSALWIVPGLASLILFAFALTKIDTQFAGRAYAAYGGVYIVASLMWVSWVEKERLVASDYIGVLVCLVGSMILLFGPRT